MTKESVTGRATRDVWYLGSMTELLTRAFEKASKLPPEAQDEIARQILEDLVAESKWDETLARTQGQLEKLADQALAELKAGRTVEMGFDEL